MRYQLLGHSANHSCPEGTSQKTITDNLAALEWTLSEIQLKCLDEVSSIEMDFSVDYLDRSRYVFSATRDLIDDYRQ